VRFEILKAVTMTSSGMRRCIMRQCTLKMEAVGSSETLGTIYQINNVSYPGRQHS
jgi:hypothetical protein